MQNIYSGIDWDLAAYLKYTRVKLAFPFDHLCHLNTTVFIDDYQGYHHRYLLPPPIISTTKSGTLLVNVLRSGSPPPFHPLHLREL